MPKLRILPIALTATVIAGLLSTGIVVQANTHSAPVAKQSSAVSTVTKTPPTHVNTFTTSNEMTSPGGAEPVITSVTTPGYTSTPAPGATQAKVVTPKVDTPTAPVTSAPVANIFGSLSYKAGSTNVKASDWLFIKGTIPTSSPDRIIYLQQYNTTTQEWESITSDWSDKGKFSEVLPPEETPSATYRLYTDAVGSLPESISYSMTLNRAMQAVSIKVATDSQGNRVVPWVSLTMLWTVNVPIGTSAKVQRLDGKAWTTVGTTKVNKNGQVAFNSVKGTTKSHSQNIIYRVDVLKADTGWKETAGGNQYTKWVNPLGYTGVAAKVYNYAKAKCPTTLIDIQNSKMGNVSGGGQIWGLTHMGYNYETIYGGIPAKYLQTVALHECGHEYQWKFYSDNFSQFETSMNKIYGQKGVLGMEQNADCIANAWHKNSYFGYKGNCNGTRGTAAKTIASNKKY